MIGSKPCADYVRGGTQRGTYSPEETVTVPCPLCGSGDRRRIYTEHAALGISQCQACSLLYTSPRIKSPEQIYWGAEETYYAEAKLIFEGRARHHRDPNYREELDLIARYRPTGRFLDVGCSTGMLLRLVRERGWQAEGVEPSPSLARLASEQFRLTVHNCFLHEMPDELAGVFDVIALSDVFEHICSPKDFLRDAARLLAPDGIMYVKVPNARWNLLKQWALGLMGQRPEIGVWDSCEHVIHYTDSTLRQVLATAGLRTLRQTIARPVQTPIWHEWVGHYYQYPCPWALDWKRQTGRVVAHTLALAERLLRVGSIGYLSPNIAAIVRKPHG
jgi:SAM-dependent methyltransferase